MRRKTCTYKIGSITRWHYDRDDKGTVRRRGGGGGKKRVKERTRSSYAEDGRRENLEVIRRRRIWPEAAVNGSLSQQGVFRPTLWPSSRVARRCATYHIALLSPHQQTTNPRKKKSNRTRYGYRKTRTRGVPVKEESLERVVGWKKKIRRREAKNGQRGYVTWGR